MRAGFGPGQGFHIIDPGRAGLARNLYFQSGPGRAGIIEHMFKSGPGRASKFGQMQDSILYTLSIVDLHKLLVIVTQDGGNKEMPILNFYGNIRLYKIYIVRLEDMFWTFFLL